MRKRLSILALVLAIGVGSAYVYGDKPIKVKSDPENIEGNHIIDLKPDREEGKLEEEEEIRDRNKDSEGKDINKNLEKWQEEKLQRRKDKLERRKQRLKEKVERGYISEEKAERIIENQERSIKYHEERNSTRRDHHDRYHNEEDHHDHHHRRKK